MPYEIVRFPYDGTVDADGHVLEPGWLWEEYLEERYRDRALRIRTDAEGLEYLELDGRASERTTKGILGLLGAMGDLEVKRGPDRRYMDHIPFGGGDAKERIALLEQENLDLTVLYPTLGLLWECEVTDPELTVAYQRAYNRWIADFCRDSGGRLIPIAHLSLGDPAEAARELERAVKDGCRGAFVCPFTITRVPHGDPRHDAVFAAAQDLDVPLAVHPTFEPVAFNVHHRFDKFGWAVWYFNLFAGQGVQQAFATFFQFGVFERFPRLRVVVLESQAGWIGYFLDRADATFTGTPLGATVRLKEKPSYYFKRQCFISADPDERTIAALMPHVGEDKFFWASDYPHPDHPGAYLEELKGMVAPMTESGRRGILGENVARAYRLA